MEFILSLIDIETISALHWKVKGPALAIIAYLLFRVFSSVLKFRLIKAAFSVIYTIILSIILTYAGTSIEKMVVDETPQQTNQQ